MSTLIDSLQINQHILVYVRDAKHEQGIWKEGIVIKKDIIHPNAGKRHRPYPMVFVRVKRWYFLNSTWNTKTYQFDGELVEKDNVEAFIYDHEIKLKENCDRCNNDLCSSV